ncbi:hypothetical protein M231_00060 [Tremella mesenterica]|uniref:ferric-chelate reductase (NADPH) n=1 Tax=Tremella mesenterica TaxID=5217 RepID=A0A4Q1BWQ0_TREME|nr:hypothetical protein M231_00060 [Tremella mesenterica]
MSSKGHAHSSTVEVATSTNTTPTTSGKGHSGTAAAAGATTTKAAAKKKVDKNIAPTREWQVIVGILFLLLLLNLFRRYRSRHSAKKRARKTTITSGGFQGVGTSFSEKDAQDVNGGSSGKDNRERVIVEKKKQGGMVMVGRSVIATMAIWEKWMYVRTLPKWLFGWKSLSEIVWTVMYFAIALGLGMKDITLKPVNWSNQMGILAFAQTPLIVGLASKNNVISFLTGIPYQHLNYLHRASGRLAFACSWAHMAGRIQHGLRGKTDIHSMTVRHGIVAIIFLTLLSSSSLRVIRRLWYELFIVCHIVFAFLFLLFACLHYPEYIHWVWPAFLLWGLDRIVSGLRMMINSLPITITYSLTSLPRVQTKSRGTATDCIVELVDKDVLRISVPMSLPWSPGQHAFLSMPSISKWRFWEQHPHSISNLCVGPEPKAVFIVRAHKGFTGRLRDAITSDSSVVLAFVDGPYGKSPVLGGYDSIILVAGGTGITHCLSLFLHIAINQPDSHVKLIWNVRHASYIGWLAPMLNQHVASFSSKAKIIVHVTRSPLSAEFEDLHGLSDTIADGMTELWYHHDHQHHQQHVTLDKTTYNPISPTNGTSENDSGPSSENATIDEKVIPSPSSSSVLQVQTPGVNSSDEKTNTIEAEVKVAVRPESRKAFGLDEATKRLITFRPGRVNMHTVLADEVEHIEGKINVTVCGPEALSRDVREAVKTITTVKAILGGQAVVAVHEETFGW